MTQLVFLYVRPTSLRRRRGVVVVRVLIRDIEPQGSIAHEHSRDLAEDADERIDVLLRRTFPTDFQLLRGMTVGQIASLQPIRRLMRMSALTPLCRLLTYAACDCSSLRFIWNPDEHCLHNPLAPTTDLGDDGGSISVGRTARWHQQEISNVLDRWRRHDLTFRQPVIVCRD